MIIHGDSLNELKNLDAESVDVVVTDPPYGYSFMGKSWDKALPDIGIFKECLRVLKPGAFAFVMSAPRSDVCARMMLLLEDAGFEIGFTPIYWTYASGFPKAMNIGKMVDKRGGVERNIAPHTRTDTGFRLQAGGTASLPPTTDAAKALDGSYGGFQPKPAVEVIIVAMKPLSEKTYVDQALKNGKGITWLDDCRIPTTEKWSTKGMHDITGGNLVGSKKERGDPQHSDDRGRFPANLLVSDDVLNDGVERKSGAGNKNTTNRLSYGGQLGAGNGDGTGGATGSYSRYFDLDAWAKTLPFLIVPKAAKSEKNAGGVKCIHPTVKPLKLMSYLITLGSRPGDTVLDPFLGSGTTAVAAKQLGRECVGIEREEEYVRIAEARIAAIPTPPSTLFPT